MQTKPEARAYSIGQRRIPLPRRSSAKKRRAFGDILRLLTQVFDIIVRERRLIVVVSLPVFVLGAILTAYSFPALNVTQVDIVGAQTLDVPSTRASLHLEGSNILSVDASTIEKILRQQPVVKSVSVRRQWPNKITVQVEERRPAAFWQTPEGIYAVDDVGFVISQSPSPGPLPVINTQEGGVRVGSTVPQGMLGLVRTLASRMPPDFGVKPRQFDYSSAQGLTVLTDQGWKVVFGDDRDTDFKLTALGAVLRTAKERGLAFQFVDLRYGERPYLRQGGE